MAARGLRARAPVDYSGAATDRIPAWMRGSVGRISSDRRADKENDEVSAPREREAPRQKIVEAPKSRADKGKKASTARSSSTDGSSSSARNEPARAPKGKRKAPSSSRAPGQALPPSPASLHGSPDGRPKRRAGPSGLSAPGVEDGVLDSGGGAAPFETSPAFSAMKGGEGRGGGAAPPPPLKVTLRAPEKGDEATAAEERAAGAEGSGEREGPERAAADPAHAHARARAHAHAHARAPPEAREPRSAPPPPAAGDGARSAAAPPAALARSGSPSPPSSPTSLVAAFSQSYEALLSEHEALRAQYEELKAAKISEEVALHLEAHERVVEEHGRASAELARAWERRAEEAQDQLQAAKRRIRELEQGTASAKEERGAASAEEERGAEEEARGEEKRGAEREARGEEKRGAEREARAEAGDAARADPTADPSSTVDLDPSSTSLVPLAVQASRARAAQLEAEAALAAARAELAAVRARADFLERYARVPETADAGVQVSAESQDACVQVRLLEECALKGVGRVWRERDAAGLPAAGAGRREHLARALAPESATATQAADAAPVSDARRHDDARGAHEDEREDDHVAGLERGDPGRTATVPGPDGRADAGTSPLARSPGRADAGAPPLSPSPGRARAPPPALPAWEADEEVVHSIPRPPRRTSLLTPSRRAAALPPGHLFSGPDAASFDSSPGGARGGEEAGREGGAWPRAGAGEEGDFALRPGSPPASALLPVPNGALLPARGKVSLLLAPDAGGAPSPDFRSDVATGLPSPSRLPDGAAALFSPSRLPGGAGRLPGAPLASPPPSALRSTARGRVARAGPEGAEDGAEGSAWWGASVCATRGEGSTWQGAELEDGEEVQGWDAETRAADGRAAEARRAAARGPGRRATVGGAEVASGAEREAREPRRVSAPLQAAQPAREEAKEGGPVGPPAPPPAARQRLAPGSLLAALAAKVTGTQPAQADRVPHTVTAHAPAAAPHATAPRTAAAAAPHAAAPRAAAADPYAAAPQDAAAASHAPPPPHNGGGSGGTAESAVRPGGAPEAAAARFDFDTLPRRSRRESFGAESRGPQPHQAGITFSRAARRESFGEARTPPRCGGEGGRPAAAAFASAAPPFARRASLPTTEDERRERAVAGEASTSRPAETRQGGGGDAPPPSGPGPDRHARGHGGPRAPASARRASAPAARVGGGLWDPAAPRDRRDRAPHPSPDLSTVREETSPLSGAAWDAAPAPDRAAAAAAAAAAPRAAAWGAAPALAAPPPPSLGSPLASSASALPPQAALEALTGLEASRGSRRGVFRYLHASTGFRFEIGPPRKGEDDEEGMDLAYEPLDLGSAGDRLAPHLKERILFSSAQRELLLRTLMAALGKQVHLAKPIR